MCTTPSRKIWAASGQPAAGRVNCGSNARNSSNALGLRPLIAIPLIAWRKRDSVDSAPPVPGIRGRANVLIPSHIR
jgi:hypothetical protein